MTKGQMSGRGANDCSKLRLMTQLSRAVQNVWFCKQKSRRGVAAESTYEMAGCHFKFFYGKPCVCVCVRACVRAFVHACVCAFNEQ